MMTKITKTDNIPKNNIRIKYRTLKIRLMCIFKYVKQAEKLFKQKKLKELKTFSNKDKGTLSTNVFYERPLQQN